jgi:hypothetical protein
MVRWLRTELRVAQILRSRAPARRYAGATSRGAAGAVIFEFGLALFILPANRIAHNLEVEYPRSFGRPTFPPAEQPAGQSVTPISRRRPKVARSSPPRGARFFLFFSRPSEASRWRSAAAVFPRAGGSACACRCVQPPASAHRLAHMTALLAALKKLLLWACMGFNGELLYIFAPAAPPLRRLTRWNRLGRLC